MNAALRRLYDELAWLSRADQRVATEPGVTPDLAAVYLEQISREIAEVAVAIDRLETKETNP